jgi:pantetheine-phosphate adenylyltransferase
MTKAVFPGSFDPFTLGHVDIVARARALFDHVVVVVADNSTKAPLLTVDERVALAAEATAGFDDVEVAATGGLIVDFCAEIGATVIVKGLRGGADYDMERPMALMNRALSGVETVFVSGDPALQHVASSLVRDVARHGGSIARLVPPGVEPVVVAALDRARRSR